MNPGDSHLTEEHIGVVRTGTDESPINSRRYYRNRLGQQRDVGQKARDWEGGAQDQGLIQYQEAPNSQLRAEFHPSLVPE